VAEPRLGLIGTDLRITGPAPVAPPATVDEWRGHPVTRREATDLGSHSSDHAGELVSRNVWQRHRLMATPGVPVRPAYAGGPNRDHRAVLGTVGFSHVANQGRRAHDVIDDRFHQMAFPGWLR